MEAGAQWKTWLVHDQRFVSDRPDVLVYQTAKLDKPMHIMGAPQVDLFAATSGTDSDWVVSPSMCIRIPHRRLTSGAQPGMAGFGFPSVSRSSEAAARGFDQPAALVPGKVQEYKFGLPNVDHVFLPGHKIMIQVQSSLFPLYDRNPQTYVDNIFNAKPENHRPATESVYRGAATASMCCCRLCRRGESRAHKTPLAFGWRVYGLVRWRWARKAWHSVTSTRGSRCPRALPAAPPWPMPLPVFMLVAGAAVEWRRTVAWAPRRSRTLFRAHCRDPDELAACCSRITPSTVPTKAAP